MVFEIKNNEIFVTPLRYVNKEREVGGDFNEHGYCLQTEVPENLPNINVYYAMPSARDIVHANLMRAILDARTDTILVQQLSLMEAILTHRRFKKERLELLDRGLNYEEAKLCRILKVENVVQFPNSGFWVNIETARNMICVTLDLIPSFSEARAKNDIKTMADLYRKHVIKYESKNKEKYSYNGQHSFFCEVGGLEGLMGRPRDFLAKKNSPAAILRFALPGLIDLRNPYALDPLEVEHDYWTDPQNARYHIYQALDTIPSFGEARAKNDIKTMADLYRKHVIEYEPKDKEKYSYNGQQSFFYEVGGLRGLITNPRDFFAESGSPAAILRFALPGLIDLRNPYALDPLEVEYDYWTDPQNARYHIYQALDTIPSFGEARAKNDIKTMADLYRKHVIKYEPKDKEKYSYNGQHSFFCEAGGLRGLMSHPRDFLAESDSPAAILRFALPGLVDDENTHALHTSEVKHFYGKTG